MFLKADFFVRCGQIGTRASGLMLAAAGLAGCACVPALKTAPAAALETAVQAPAAVNACSTTGPSAPLVATAPPPASEPVVQLLAYADRVRAMSAAELAQEATRLGNPYQPASQLQLALVLAQLRQTPELIRAQEVLTRLLANPDAQALILHPLARLLAARYGEQRRLEDLLDKQTQQTRDAQRRLDQTNERLEALKAIERSLTSRPPAPAASAPASRARTPASAPTPAP
ncbi:MAG: hypothetical protein JWP96_2849 [Polaromonas sp.]|nr:hypothetical protein [Polaromonas sp.]